MLTETKRVENHDRVVALLNSVERDGVSDLLKWLEESDFFTAPASRAYHAELNTKSDFCQECGYDGEIQIVENEDGKLIWECPNCGNGDRAKMNIARRTCGYIGVNDFNQGRTQEIKERYVHLGGE